MRNHIIANGGSIADIPDISAEMKEIYRTVWEIRQRSLIDMAADRGNAESCRSVLCCAAVLYCAVPCCTVLYCTVLCCTLLCCTLLCRAVLYCAVLCSAVADRGRAVHSILSY